MKPPRFNIDQIVGVERAESRMKVVRNGDLTARFPNTVRTQSDGTDGIG